MTRAAALLESQAEEIGRLQHEKLVLTDSMEKAVARALEIGREESAPLHAQNEAMRGCVEALRPLIAYASIHGGPTSDRQSLLQAASNALRKAETT